MQRKSVLAIFALCCVVATAPLVRAATLKVNCNKNQTITHALKVIAATNPQGPNTIFVSGSCKENLSIQSIDRLTLITNNSASITDSSNGILAVIGIVDSHSVTVQGFEISGGNDGIICSLASTCFLTANTVEGSLGQEGIAVTRGANAVLDSNTIKNNTSRGITVANNAQAHSFSDTITGNTYQGVVVNSGGYLNANNCVIQNNGTYGVLAVNHSTLRLISCTITNNGTDGVRLGSGAEAQVDAYYGPMTVSANAGNGVTVSDLSFAGFETDSITVTGNLSGTDVVCLPQYSATRGALTNIGGGSTNCVEPEQPSKQLKQEAR